MVFENGKWQSERSIDDRSPPGGRKVDKGAIEARDVAVLPIGAFNAGLPPSLTSMDFRSSLVFLLLASRDEDTSLRSS